MKKYGFGVDVGGTTIKLGLFETSGKLISKWEIKTNTEDRGSRILPDVAQAIEKKLEQERISKEEVQGIGVGVPGPVKEDGMVLVCVNLGWEKVNVAETLKNLTGLRVKAGNDANVAALGEMWQGGGKGYQDVVMVTLGTGVGGGIIVGGKIVAGSTGSGGEIGHLMVNEKETDLCNCGKPGCLEQYVSATGIVRMARKKLGSVHETSELDKASPLSAKAVFDAAKAGDKLANELVDDFARILGTALAGVACVVNPEIFVIGGGVSKAGSIITDTVSRYYRERTFSGCAKAKLALASLGNDAGMYGCIQMILSE